MSSGLSWVSASPRSGNAGIKVQCAGCPARRSMPLIASARSRAGLSTMSGIALGSDKAHLHGKSLAGDSSIASHTVRVRCLTENPRYIAAVPSVRSELAVPLITKNRVIGVIDLEAREPGYFNEEHSRLLTLVASRRAAGIENAQL